ncbi:MAG: hypothetical protein JST70_08095 [Bacteroidetes bacterium]|nr:hypothetical protein [Bacteroidota bacterium]
MKSVKQTTEVQPKSKGYISYLMNVWVLLPALLLFKVINEYSVNIPYVDDYPSILGFLSRYKNASFRDKIALFWEQTNEHRTVYSKMVYLIYYKLYGDVNFFDLIILNNLHWVAAFVMMVVFIRKMLPARWNIAAFVTAVAMFDINNYENSNAAMFGMVNYAQVFFFLLSLYFYDKENKKFLWLAVLFQAVCIFSSGAGLIISVSLLAFNILRRNKLNVITCLATSIIFGALYFVNYIKPAPQGSSDWGVRIEFFLHELGAHFGYIYGVYFGVLVAIALVLVLPIKKWKTPSEAQPFIAILIFCLASLAATAVLRSGFKMLDSYSSRYFIYPHLIVSIIFIFMLARVEGKKYQWQLTIGFILLMLYTYRENYDYGVAGFERAQYRLQYEEYYWPFPDKDTPRKIAEQACKEDIYCIQNER